MMSHIDRLRSSILSELYIVLMAEKLKGAEKLKKRMHSIKNKMSRIGLKPHKQKISKKNLEKLRDLQNEMIAMITHHAADFEKAILPSIEKSQEKLRHNKPQIEERLKKFKALKETLQISKEQNVEKPAEPHKRIELTKEEIEKKQEKRQRIFITKQRLERINEAEAKRLYIIDLSKERFEKIKTSLKILELADRFEALKPSEQSTVMHSFYAASRENNELQVYAQALNKKLQEANPLSVKMQACLLTLLDVENQNATAVTSPQKNNMLKIFENKVSLVELEQKLRQKREAKHSHKNHPFGFFSHKQDTSHPTHPVNTPKHRR